MASNILAILDEWLKSREYPRYGIIILMVFAPLFFMVEQVNNNSISELLIGFYTDPISHTSFPFTGS